MKVLIIIPAYNEEKNITKTVKSLSKGKNSNYELDYVIVNDGSKDMTRQVCLDNNFINMLIIMIMI